MIMADHGRPLSAPRRTMRRDQHRWIDFEARLRIGGDVTARHRPIDAVTLTEQQATYLDIGGVARVFEDFVSDRD